MMSGSQKSPRSTTWRHPLNSLRHWLHLATGAFALAFAATAHAADAASSAAAPIVIKFSVVNTLNSPKTQAALFFKREAEKRTNGRVSVEVYPNSTLYKDKEELEALQLGAVQMLAPTLGKFGPLGAKEFEVFDLPYLFDDYAQVHKVTEGPIGNRLLKSLGSRNILGLAFWDNGFKQMNADRPLHRPEDFKGLKMRIFSSKILEAQFRALGAIPQVLPASDMYMAMQSGLVNGNENTESTFYQFKFYEVQKDLMLSGHGYVGYAVVANKSFWDGLPPDIRATLEAIVREATAFNNSIAEKENVDSLALIRKTGKTEVVALTPAERLAWKKALLPVHREAEGRVGKELIDAVYREIGFDPNK
jgi:C4-dicarboxylate-binding protein DctP